MASPNTLKLRAAPKAPRVHVSGAAMALTMKAENAAYKAWAHEGPASGTAYHGPRTREAFKRQHDARKRINAAAEEIVKAEEAKKASRVLQSRA